MAYPMQFDIFGWLAKYQVSGADAANVVASFDPGKSINEQPLEQGAELYQFVRAPSGGAPFIQTGRYFGLSGATPDGLAIFDGASGRNLQRYVVIHPFTAVEGTARDRADVEREAKRNGRTDVHATDWKLALAGPGGQTQIFVPYCLLGHLRCEGSADRRPYSWWK